jgi:hypothetical protein
MFPPMPAALCRLKISSAQISAKGINQIAGISSFAWQSLSPSLQVVPSKARGQESARDHVAPRLYYNTSIQICALKRGP